MNLRNSIFASFSALFFAAYAFAGEVILQKSDFASATREIRNGQSILLAKLSPKGLAKFKELGQEGAGKEIELQLAGETHHLRLKVLISDGNLEVGPFSEETARKMIDEIQAN